MTENTALWLALAIGYAGWLGHLLIRWRSRARARRRDAQELIRSARAGTDLAPHTDFHDHPKTDVAANFHHWSDVCAQCHHDRNKHHLGFGICLHVRTPNDVCDCTAFETSP